ncbi:17119_t:CDS:2 [Cetraspora pellucida]|uniref:17119_t:CDS:1 n=1 Tax=Cetraspora pellucida TaxID=1433469 RepID=A0ACA9KMM8_9GLOM|nr:17119_t:CDS:2 [Cetraspora pellucida]
MIEVYYEDGSKEIAEPLSGNLQTNNRAKLYTVIRALETYKDPIKKNNEWKTVKDRDVKNRDLFEKINFLITKRSGQVYFTHVFGHRGVTGNETADKLARRDAAIKMNESKKLSPYNAFMKTNLPIIKKNNPDLDHKAAFKLVALM